MCAVACCNSGTARCRGASIGRDWYRSGCATGAACGRSPSSPIPRTRRTCASWICMAARASWPRESGSADPAWTTSSTPLTTCMRWACAIRTSNACWKRRSSCRTQGLAHALQGLLQARALGPEVQSEEARRAELLARRDGDPVLQENLIWVLHAAGVDPGEVGGLDSCHRERQFALHEIAVGAQI